MRATDKRQVVFYESSMQCHIHIHKNLHSAMYGMWRKWVFAQESGVEKQLRNQNRTQSSSRLVAAKKNPHPEKKKMYP